MSQVTLRNLPESMERLIRREAHRKGMSLNKTIIKILEKGLGVRTEAERKRDLGDLAGRWDEKTYKEFMDSQSIFETIDREIWSS